MVSSIGIRWSDYFRTKSNQDYLRFGNYSKKCILWFLLRLAMLIVKREPGDGAGLESRCCTRLEVSCAFVWCHLLVVRDFERSSALIA